MTESDLLRSICDYLALKKHFFWRQNTSSTYDSKGGFFRRMPPYAKKGVPDIILIRQTGRFVGLEVKLPKGKLSPDQRTFEIDSMAMGAEYHVVRSIDDIITLGL